MGSHQYFLTFEKGNCQLNLDMLTPSLRSVMTRVGARSEPDLNLRAANEFQIANDLKQ